MNLGEAFNAAVALHDAGRLDQAEPLYREVLAHQPRHAEALHRLGVLLYQRGRAAEGIEFLQRAIECDPAATNYYTNLGVVLADQKRFEQAREIFRQALALRADVPEVHNNLGNVLKEFGDAAGAVSAYRQAIRLRPDYPEAHHNLGNMLYEVSQFDEAVTEQQKAIALRPQYGEAYCSLGNVLRQQGKMDEAIAAYQRAVELRPAWGEAYNNLGGILQETGRLSEAVACYRKAAELTKDLRVTDNLLVLLHLDSANDAKAIYEEHARWNRTYARQLAPLNPHFPNDRSEDRRLRIGYVSAYFNGHPVGRFLTPLFENHNHERLEVFCYSDVIKGDATTDRLRSGADVWRDVVRLNDEQLAQQIRSDQIDILVDLGMHTNANRIFVFARKPAPVQVTYLAYCSTTGLETMDYRLSDSFLDPDDCNQPYYSERTVRLRSYWCYPAPGDAPEVNGLPFTSSGCMTFGCLNNFSKVTDAALSIWLEILRNVGDSRLILHAPEGTHRLRARQLAEASGIDPQRIEFVGKAPISDYFRQYHAIDTALDPTPYGGGTTTCDALWMGVPVISLAGRTAVSRGGLSILSHIGLPELVASTVAQYVQIAIALAGDVARLTELRAGLRQRMQCSVLMDAPGFALNFEAALREMWRSWVRQSSGTPSPALPRRSGGGE